MNIRELVDHIRSGPAKLLLNIPLRLRRRTRSNPCDFDEFLQALQSSETIRTVRCGSQQSLGITEDEWVLLVKTLGRIRDIDNLRFWCKAGSRDFHPFQAVAQAVNNARSLHKLAFSLNCPPFPRDSSGLTALTSALREHSTLQEFMWFDSVSRMESAPQDLSPDLMLRALPACSHLREVFINTKYASAGAMKTLLQLPKDTRLVLALGTEHWMAVADGIRQGHCNIKDLYLALYLQDSSPQATEAVKVIASAIRLDHHLEHLKLQMNFDFTDEAGVALAEALTVNKTLRKIILSVEHVPGGQYVQDALRAPAYEAFCAMLRVNTYLVLELPPFNDTTGDGRLVDSRNRMRIEQGLNAVGRGSLLSSSQTTREEWVDALSELNSNNIDESPEFNVSCLYSLLRLNPATCM
jgi:hypothetical protein